MTDCLPEDDDETHHPVFRFETIVPTCTCCAGEKRSCSNPEYTLFSAHSEPLSRAVPADMPQISPVFYNHHACGLMEQ